jgi:protein-disulfide isomerase/uncharacterized membrane protein
LQTEIRSDLEKREGVNTPERAFASCACLPVAALFVAFGGLFAAGILSLGHILKLPVPCGSSSGCASVAAHHSSIFLGVPIAFFGVAAYIGIIFLLTRASEAWARWWLLGITAAGTSISAMLLVYAQLIIRATCWWCVVSGLAMVTLFLLSLCLWRSRSISFAASPAFLWWFSAITAVGLGTGTWWMERNAAASPISAEKLGAVPVAQLLHTRNTRGPADAPVKIIVFSDLGCSVCRAVHAPLMDFQSAHPAHVQVVFRHRPLTWVHGHETSAAAAALSEIAAERGKFWEFVERMYAQTDPLDPHGYLRVMRDLGLPESDANKLAGASPVIPSGQVERDIALADQLGVRFTPTFVVIVGANGPVSANHRSLAEILNSDSVQAILRQREPVGPVPR